MLGEKIHLLRKREGMTQEQLAERLAITRQTVSKWELGESEPDVAYLIQLSEIFQVTTDYLLKDAPFTPPVAEDMPAAPMGPPSAPRYTAKFWLGCICTAIGALGVLTFWALSIIYPTFFIWYSGGGQRTVFYGLRAFLHHHTAWGFFFFIIAIGLIGLALLFFQRLRVYLKDTVKNIDQAVAVLENVERKEDAPKDVETHRK